MKKFVLLFIAIILCCGCSVKKNEEVTDAERFDNEYAVGEKNPFQYVTIDEALDILENGDGIIFLGNSDCDWCVLSAQLLTEVLNYKNIKKAYYYNPKIIRDENTKKYKKLVKMLEPYLEKDNNDKYYLFLPDVYFVRDGEIIGHNNDMATMDGTVDTISEKTKKEIKKKYLELISEYNIGECNDC